jgi:hypothetical protein
VKKDSQDDSQTGIQIDNGPRGHVDSISACYAVSPSSGDSFARFHVGWVRNIYYFIAYTLCYQVHTFNNYGYKHNLI